MEIKETIKKITEEVKTMERKKLYLFSSLAVVVLVVIVVLFARNDEGYANHLKQEPPITVSAVTVASRTIDSVVSAAGALSSKNISMLSSKIMGTVEYLGVNEGDYVKAGSLLLKIDSGEINAQVHQAQAAYNNAKLHYDRIKSLYDDKAATHMEMDQATLGIKTAEAGLRAAKAMKSYTSIVAPISGQIVGKRINRGEMANPGQPLIKIEDNRNLRLEVLVKEQDIMYVQPGKPVRVEIDALPGKSFTGTVSQVVPASDVRTHSFLVKINIPSVKGLITGMYGRAYFTTGEREVILVPRSAIVAMAGLSGVYIVSPEGRAVFQIVQLGEEHGEGTEVFTGLKTGDQVISGGYEGRIEGRKVVLAENGEGGHVSR